MLDRFAFYSGYEEIITQWKINEKPSFSAAYNSFPSRLSHVIYKSDDFQSGLFHWGLMSKWSNDKPMSRKLFNVYFDEVLNKKSLQNSFEKRRCVIPVNGFYLWKPISKKQQVPYYFHLAKDKVFYLPALWEETDEFSEIDAPSFLIILKNNMENFADFQNDFPVTLNFEDAKKWLEAGNLDENILIHNSIEKKIELHPVTPRIKDKSYNESDAVIAAKPADQLGNYTLFG